MMSLDDGLVLSEARRSVSRAAHYGRGDFPPQQPIQCSAWVKCQLYKKVIGKCKASPV
jgi:hypothetical protein